MDDDKIKAQEDAIAAHQKTLDHLKADETQEGEDQAETKAADETADEAA